MGWIGPQRWGLVPGVVPVKERQREVDYVRGILNPEASLLLMGGA